MKNIKRKAVALTLCGIMTASTSIGFATVAKPVFSDMPAVGHWARPGLELAVEYGILNGAGGKIMPYGNVTRAQMAAIVNKVMGANTKSDITGYTDIDPKAWYYDDMAKAVHLGIFSGSGGKLSPNANITREQVCVVLANALNLPVVAESTLNSFPDGKSVNLWAREAMASMVASGYMNGKSGWLKPQDSLTRAELAAIMKNMVQTYLNKSGTYKGIFEGNVVLNSPGVTFNDATIKGDLFIGDGLKASDIDLSGLTVLGKIIVRGSQLKAELEKQAEEIAIGTVPSGSAGTGSGTGTPPGTVTPPSVDTVMTLTSVSTKLQSRVVPKLTTNKQIQAANIIVASIESFIKDASYDISGDVAQVRALRLQMTDVEAVTFKNTITGNIPVSELVALNSYFKVIEY